MHRLLAVVALLGFCLSLLVHIAALLGTDPSDRFPLIWLLHVGIFVVFIPLVFSSRKRFGSKPTFADLRANFPAWAVALGVAVFVYVGGNFLLFILSTQGGSPSMQAGKFILQSHGHFIREITSAEYTSFKANEVRGFSGHWLAFYYIACIYFAFEKKSNPSFKRTPDGAA